MECRHCDLEWRVEHEYCPVCRRNFGGAIWPNIETEHEIEQRGVLIACIRDAFRGTAPGNGTTIHEADLEGCYTDDSERLAARAKDTETNWEDVPNWKIERFSSVMPFFDAEGYRFYIPAYMIWTLKNWRTSSLFIVDSVLWSFGYRSSDFNAERHQILSPVQLHASYRFIKHFCEFSGDEEQLHAMKTFWYKYAEPPKH